MIEEVFRCQYCEKQFEEHCLQEHTEICPFKLVDCENNCGVKVYQRDIINHKTNDCTKKSVICEHCKHNFIAIRIEEHHNECPKMMIKCPHVCKTSLVLREELNIHFENICSVLTEPCVFEYANCTFRGAKNAVDKHIEESCSYHLQLLGGLVVEQNKQLRQINENLTLILQNVIQLSNGIVWKIIDWDKKMNTAKSEIRRRLFSPMFHTHPNGYKMQAELCPNGFESAKGTHMFFNIHPGDHDDHLSWPFTKKTTITLTNQTQNVNYTKTIYPTMPNADVASGSSCFKKPKYSKNDFFGYPNFITLQQLNKSRFVEDDCIYLKFQYDD